MRTAAWAQWLWPALLNHLWLATLTAAAWAAMMLLKRAAARVRYGVWLWKVAQFELGWPTIEQAAGVSHAAGANLKRRIELMLNHEQMNESTLAPRARAVVVIALLVVVAVAGGLLPRGAAQTRHEQTGARKPATNDEQSTTIVAPGGPTTGVVGGVAGGVAGGLGNGADAKLSDIRVERGLPDGLTEQAIEAAQTIRFLPALKDGVPVSVRGKLEYQFRL